MQPERLIQNEILRYLATIPNVRIWRANSGVAKMGPRTVRFGTVGQGDITGVAGPLGRRIEIEVKANGAQSEQQKHFQAMIERFGGIYLLCRSVDDAREGLRSSGVIS